MEKIAFNYKLTALNVLSVFKVVEKEKKRTKRNIAYAVIFLLIAGYWLYSYFSDPSSYRSIILAVIAFGFLMATLYLPSKNRKDIARAVEAADENLYMEFSEGNIYFNEEKTDFVPMGAVKFYETNGEFVIDTLGEKVYCIPKESVGEEISGRVRELLRSAGLTDLRKHLEEKVNG